MSLNTHSYLAAIAPYGHVNVYGKTMELSSLLNRFNSYLYLTELNMTSQLLILHIKMEPLSVCGAPYFPWQGVSLLSQNCPKTCVFTHW